MTLRAERWALGSGIVFTILLFIGVTTIGGNLPDVSGLHAHAANTKVLHAYAKSGTRAALLVGGYLTIAAGLVLIWFLSGLRARLRRTGEGDVLASVVFSFGVVAAVLTMAAGGAFATIAGDLSFGSDPGLTRSGADVARLLPELGYPLLTIGGMLALGVVIALASVAALRHAALPRWLGYAGWLAVVGAIFAVTFLPMALVALWFLAVGVVGLMTKTVTTPVTASPVAAAV